MSYNFILSKKSSEIFANGVKSPSVLPGAIPGIFSEMWHCALEVSDLCKNLILKATEV